MAQFKTGDLVEYASFEPDEIGLAFIVTEYHADVDRGLMTLVCSLPLPPTYVFRGKDVKHVTN